MCHLKKCIVRNFAKFTGTKNLCQVQAGLQLYFKKETPAQVFSVNFAKFLTTHFFLFFFGLFVGYLLDQLNILLLLISDFPFVLYYLCGFKTTMCRIYKCYLQKHRCIALIFNIYSNLATVFHHSHKK